MLLKGYRSQETAIECGLWRSYLGMTIFAVLVYFWRVMSAYQSMYVWVREQYTGIFSLLPAWRLEIELRSSCLDASDYTRWGILLVSRRQCISIYYVQKMRFELENVSYLLYLCLQVSYFHVGLGKICVWSQWQPESGVKTSGTEVRDAF